jgi:hypothetical protein
MGRKIKNIDDKKSKISITVLPKINKQLEELRINKSKLINWLLLEHFNHMININ